VSNNRQNYAQDLQVSSRGFGARASFGVRGVRLHQDDIPATMPDGQGQTGSFSLLSARAIEVLRGPFSSLYGNASGGVIAVFTEDGRLPPSLTANVGAGSYGARTAGLKANGVAGSLGYVVATSRFDTDGYRRHSAATRDLANVKLTLEPSADTSLTLLGSGQEQPESQDPLGLTRPQWEADPRQVDPAALQFDTRKTIRQTQGGAHLEHRLSRELALKVVGHAGARAVRQYLAFSGAGAASSGGSSTSNAPTTASTRGSSGRPGSRRVRSPPPWARKPAGSARNGADSSTRTGPWATCAATRTIASATRTATCR